MRVLGFDLETTGLEKETDFITEIGAVLWDVPRRQPLAIFSKLINWSLEFKTPVEISPEIEKLTGITTMDLLEFGENGSFVLEDFDELVSDSEYTVAHNGYFFDSPFLFNMAGRAKVELSSFENRKLIDTSFDLPSEAYTRSRSLSYLAADHGFLNPFPHRAVTDVLTMMKIFSCYDPIYMVERAHSPFVHIAAKLTYDDKHLIDGKGFRWDKPVKTWRKVLRQCDYEAQSKEWNFDYVVSEEETNVDDNSKLHRNGVDNSGGDQLLLEERIDGLDGSVHEGNQNEVQALGPN